MSITVAGNPMFQAFDANGDPLSGGKLYTYEAGTSTPLATYQDYALSVANTNPVVLDSRGEAPVFLSGSYKFVLKDSADVTIYTIDYINETPVYSDWTEETASVAYVDADSFTVVGDVTTTYEIDRALLLSQTTDKNDHVKSATYSAVSGKTTIEVYQGTVDGGLTSVSYGPAPGSSALGGQSSLGHDTVVRRDANNDFSANEVTADLLGTSSMSKDAPINNGSFEIDINSDGIPDGWTFSAYPGGSGTLVSTPNAHGLNAFSMTHPGGASNGGGQLESDYLECSEYIGESFRFILWDTASAKNIINILWFTDAKSSISTTTLYSSTATPATPTLETHSVVPPAGARYLKIRLIGGYTDTDSAGVTYFGLVSRQQAITSTDMPEYIAGNYNVGTQLAAITTGASSYTKQRELVVDRDGVLRVVFSMLTSNASGTAYGRIYVNGSAVGTERTTTSISFVSFSEDITVARSDLIQIYAYNTLGATQTTTIGEIFVRASVPTGIA